MAAPRSRSRVFLFSLILALAGLLLLELAARAMLSLGGIEPVIPVEVGRPDARLGWALEPSAQASSSRLGSSVEYRINAHGWRDQDTTFDKPEGVFRIVLLGDSITFGFGVPIEQHYSRLLEGYFDQVEVINLGVSGYGVGQELLALREHGLRYEPNLVLAYVAHYADQRHMHTQRWGKSKPRFVLTEDELRIENSPAFEPGAGGSGSCHRWLYLHSKLYLIVSEIVERLSGDTPSAHAQKQADAQRMDDPDFRERLHATGEAIVAAMRQQANDAGAEFALITKVDRLAAASMEREMPVLNPALALANPLFKLSDEAGHPNAAANGVLAWEIAQFLIDEGLVPDRRYPPDDSQPE